MKTYGKDRKACANRKLRGTNMACPCCIPHSTHAASQTKVYKKRARQMSKKIVDCDTIASGRNAQQQRSET